MVGTFLLLAAASLPSSAPPAPAGFRPTATASAHATARIRIVSGVKFGEGYTAAIPAGAALRSVRLTEYDGQIKSAELVEFQ